MSRRLTKRLERLEQIVPRCRECAERPTQVELVSAENAKDARAHPDPVCPGCGEPAERILVLLSFDPHAEPTT